MNEYAARIVAAHVALVALFALALGQPWLALLLAGDFALRAFGQASLSPLARLASQVWLPALGRPSRPTPAAPKRFAQRLGLVVSLAAFVSWLPLGQPAAARLALGVLLAFATLEAALGFCVGCWLFARLVRLHLLPVTLCESCVSAEATTPEAR